MNDRRVKRNIIQCIIFMLLLYFCLLCHILYLQVYLADELATNPLNKRGTLLGDIERGRILAQGGEELALSQDAQRIYPYGAIMEPITGYFSKNVGATGIEALAGNELGGNSQYLKGLGPLQVIFRGSVGNSVKVTVDASLQERLYRALGNRKGAAIVLDAHTGAILAMVSKPSFNPENFDQQWENLKERGDAPLLNRATQGLYPPGSTIKVLMADGALGENAVDLYEKFSCTGRLEVGDTYIGESHGSVHGELTLEEALVHSCNVTFGSIALRMGGEKLYNLFDNFGLLEPLEAGFTESSCHIPLMENLHEGDIAQLGIGQGELLVTPLRMAMLASAYVNDGAVMKPYLIDEIISDEGMVLKKYSSEKWKEVTSKKRAEIIHGFMEEVVLNGTGRAAAVSGVRVTGKTGTAENATGEDHGWFIGNAELPDRTIAFCILVENGGEGGIVAAPIAREIVLELLER